MYGNDYISIDGHAEIPNGVDKICKEEFYGITELKSVSIPNTVSAIQSYAFAGCSSLTTVIIPDSVKIISGKCFDGCTSLKKVVLPKGLKCIGEYTFNGCKSLTEVIIPDKVTKIGKSAFEGCSSLTMLTVPDSVNEIGQYAFYKCSSLKTLNLPKKMTDLRDGVFAGCASLERIDIPEGVTAIEPSVFSGCTSARVHLPSTVTEFRPLKKGRYGPNEMKELSVSPDNPVLTIESDCLVDKQKRELLHILPTATVFPSDLESINIPRWAFPPLFDVEELVIPEGVTYLSTLPFMQMEKLKKLVLPTTLRCVDEGFMEKYPFSSISVPVKLLLSDNFKPWKDICRADLLGITSVTSDLKYWLPKKFPVNRWTEKLLCVYVDGQMIYPAAHVVKIKEEDLKRKAEEQAEEQADPFRYKKKEMVERVEDVTLDSLCKATFDPDGIEYSYSEYTNTVSVGIPGLMRLTCGLRIEKAMDDLAVLRDVITPFRDALIPYFSAAPDGCIKYDQFPSRFNVYGFKQDGIKYISGMPFPDTSVLLSVDENSAEAAFLALENLGHAYKQMSQNYGDRFERSKYDYSNQLCWYLVN